MSIKQEHHSEGDNVAGNKYEEHNNYYASDKSIENTLNIKINSYEQYSKMDFTDSLVLRALKESLSDLIRDEQEKCHNIVPVGHIRNQFKNYIQDDFFIEAIRGLSEERTIEVKKVQVCYVPKDLNYSVDIEI